uniref:EGF-like domain-containing protein n=1 Tax=Ciona savignyi TaxID=51511 RepID=H2YN02_CIOSA
AARCSHVCVVRPIGSRCLCPPDFELTNDGKTCIEAVVVNTVSVETTISTTMTS